jgi:hypothetical protein
MLLALLAVVGAVQDPPTAPPAGFADRFGPLAPVHRLAFEDRGRMVLIRMPNKLWAAFNPATGAVQKVWRGEVEWKGKVFDFSQDNSAAKGQTLFQLPDLLPMAQGQSWRAEEVEVKDGVYSFGDAAGALTSPEIDGSGWTNVFAAYEETSRKGPFRFSVHGQTGEEQWFATTMHGSSETAWQWGMKMLEPKSSVFRLKVEKAAGFSKQLRRLRVYGDRQVYSQDGKALAVRWRGFRVLDAVAGAAELRYDILAEPTIPVRHTLRPTENGWQELVEGPFPASPPVMRLMQTSGPSVKYRSTHPDLPDPVAAILNPGTSALQPMPRRITWEEVK